MSQQSSNSNLEENSESNEPIKSIQQSSNLPNDEFEKIILAYYEDLHEKKLSEEKKENYNAIKEKYNTKIEISKINNNSRKNIDHISSSSKLSLESSSELNAEYSIFSSTKMDKTEPFIEINSNSKATFKNCHFNITNGIAVLLIDYSKATFEHCIFENNGFSCFLMNGSKAKFVDCIFKDNKNQSVFATFDCYCKVINCEFFDLQGKAIFGKDYSEIYIKDSNFINCKGGAATITKKSKIMIDGGVVIENSGTTALRAVNNSKIFVHDVSIENVEGNAINIDNSTGYFINCNIKKTVYPTIAIDGNKSNPIFHNCNIIENMDSFGVICSNACRPLFNDCKFIDCSTNCFTIYGFAKPHIQNCYFKNIDSYYLNIWGYSHVTYNNIESGDEIKIEDKLRIFNSSKCECKTFDEINNNEDNNNENEENDDDDEAKHSDAEILDTYKIPKKLKEIDEPEIIKTGRLNYLKLVKMSYIFKEEEKIEVDFKCSNCHKELNHDEVYCVSICGHLICKDCENLEKCPVCNRKIEKVQQLFVEDQCVICLDRKPNIISLPCGHLCMCHECSIKNDAKGFNCPLCKESGDNKLIFT